MRDKAIVLDANILIRAVLGRRVRDLVLDHASHIRFFAPDVAYADARKYLPPLLAKRGISGDAAIQVFDRLEPIISTIDASAYLDMQEAALKRISIRDADDWPVLACALILDCPIWTEDADFFGAGVATWTTDRVALYFASNDEQLPLVLEYPDRVNMDRKAEFDAWVSFARSAE